MNDQSAADYVTIESIHPWDKNPRRNQAAVQKVADSIERFGFGAPIVARKENGEIIAGHTRFDAARQLKMKMVPVRFLDISEREARLLAIADNKLAEIAEWDKAGLAELFADLEPLETLATGFGQDEIDRLLRLAKANDKKGEDPGPEPVPQVPRSVLGEVYQLGPHRLFCGDATAADAMVQLLDNEKVQLVFTDPPYNVDYTGKTKAALKINNDKMAGGAFREFLVDAFTNMMRAAVPGAGIYVCHADTEGLNFRGSMVEAGWLLKQCLIWVKDQFVMGRQDYHWQHEPILYGWAPGTHKWFGDRRQTTVWNFDRPRRNEDHPTMKPTDLIENAMTMSSEEGDLVLDPFGGSGSTLIAAANSRRIARIVELDPRYCDVIRKRWTKYAQSAGMDPGSGALECSTITPLQ